jgi:pyridoxine kinase
MATILSIQSSVVHGYVGNKAALYPLQRLGYSVDVLNTVELSNHTGYQTSQGTRKSAQELKQILHAIRNNFCPYDYILLGYVGRLDCLVVVHEFIKDQVESNPLTKLVIDPVMGDNGRFYVEKECLEAYIEMIKNLKNVLLLTPNQFEAEKLSGIAITDQETALIAMARIYNLSLNSKPNIVITSISMSSTEHLVLAGKDSDGSTFLIHFPKQKDDDTLYSGAGDLISALLLSYVGRMPLSRACQYSLYIVQHVLNISSKKPTSAISRDFRHIKELALIEALNSLDISALASCTEHLDHLERYFPIIKLDSMI